VSAPRILIVRLSAVGDVVHALPGLAALRRALPQAHIGWIVESACAPLLRGNPLLDELIVYPRSDWRKKGYLRSLPGDVRRFFAQMRRRRFDVAIDFQGLTKSALIPWLAAVPRRIGFGGEDGREISRLFYTERLRPPDDVAHVVRRNLYLLRALGIADPPLEFPFPDLSAEGETVARRLAEIGIGEKDRFVCMNPGAGWETKRWPPEYFGRLGALVARRLDAWVLLTWGPGEEDLVERVLASVPAGERERVRRAPPTTLRELAALLDRSVAVVGGDTGPVHLAAARGKPVLGIYGGSDPERNGPIGPGPVRILSNPEVSCHPCWKVRCPDPPPRCLTTIEPETAAEALCALLAPEM